VGDIREPKQFNNNGCLISQCATAGMSLTARLPFCSVCCHPLSSSNAKYLGFGSHDLMRSHEICDLVQVNIVTVAIMTITINNCLVKLL